MPFTFACPYCPTTGSHEAVIVEHQREVHPGLALGAAGPPVFRSQVEARLGYSPLRDIACRSCGRETRHDRAEGLWRHVEDGSPACSQPV